MPTPAHETTRVIGLGAGGHAKVVIDVLRAMGRYEIVGLLDRDPKLHGQDVLGIPVLGGDEALPRLWEAGLRHAFVGIGMVGTNPARIRVYETLCRSGWEVVSAIHPRAIVSPEAVMGSGITVMAGAIINPAARIGVNVIVNTAAVVEHDCVLADHVHVATGARLAGGVEIGEASFVGIGAVVREYIRIGRRAVIAAGAVVVADVADETTVMGIPARVVARVVSTHG